MKPSKIDLWIQATMLVGMVVLFICAVASTFALLSIAYDIDSFVDGDAWHAPWLNVIMRGPVQ